MKIINKLSQLGFELTSSIKEEIITTLEKKEYSKGHFLLKEEERCQYLYFLEEGMIRHFYNVDGKEFTRWISLEGDFATSLSSFRFHSPSPDNLECIISTTVYRMHRDVFFKLKNKHAEIQKIWLHFVEEQLIGYENRVRQLISMKAEERYNQFIEKYPNYLSQIPQKYIASILGVESRHLSRIRKKELDKKRGT